MSVITCPSCNTPAPPGAVFCDQCGYDLRTVTPSGSSSQQSAPAPAGVVTCPMCQHPNIAGAAFCENCGAQLDSVPAASPPPKTPAKVEPEQPAPISSPAGEQTAVQNAITGRLVLVESQVTLPIPGGKQTIVIGREDPVSGVFPDIDLDPHGGHEGGVGRKHAQLVLKDGQLFIEDLESVNGTAINRQRISPHQPQPLKSGDEVRFGKVAIIYYS